MIDLTGQKFGRLIVIEFSSKDSRSNTYWLCRCDCGIAKIVYGGNLKNGHTKSCGCLHIKHGHNTRKKRSKTYGSWDHMIQRCTNTNEADYHNYGGRGITVCDRWKKFANFLEDMGNPPTHKHSIDRINNNKGYYKSNCRWATSKQQTRNTRRNHVISYSGKTQCITDWAKDLNMSLETLTARINRYGWSIRRALTTPVQKRVL